MNRDPLINNTPLVSVLISAYDHENYISETIKSIINQTYKNIELLVIDDGSTDSTSLVIEELSVKHGFYFERQTNHGLCYTMNKLIAIAKGDYIMLAASDDYFYSDKIEKQVNFLEKHEEFAVCAGNCIMVDEFNNPLPRYFQSKRSFSIFAFNDIYKSNKVGIMILLRSKVLKEFSYDLNFKIEDWYMWLKITQKGYKIAYLDDILGYYRIHRNNTSKRLKYMHNEKVKLIKNFRPENHFRYFNSLINSYLHYYFHLIYSIIPYDLGFKRK